MGELRFPGLATGIDTGALIKQLMIVNSRKLATYQVQKTAFESQNTALGELRTKVTALRTAASALSDAGKLETFSVTSSDTDAVTLSATSQANNGSHTIEVRQLATTETWIQDTSSFSYDTDYVGGGNFIYSYNNKERVITSTAGVTTLADFVNLINNDEGNPGVTASLLNQGGKYHLMLSGQGTGEDYGISVNAKSTEVLTADAALTLASDSSQNAGLTTKITNLSQFNLIADDLNGGEKIQITGTDHFGAAITAFDLSITGNTTVGHIIDAIEEAYGGNVKATLEEGQIAVTDISSDTSLLTVTLTYDDNAGGADSTFTLPTMSTTSIGGAKSTDIALLDESTFIRTQQAQNSQIKVDGYPSTAAVSEVQTLTPTPYPSGPGETYTLTFKGQTTADISYDADAATIQAALEALSTIEAGDVTVTMENSNGFADGYVRLTFSDSLGDVPAVLVDTSGLLTPSQVSVAVVETTKGEHDYISRNSNNVSNVLTGVTFNLHEVTPDGEPVDITVNRNLSAISGKVSTLANAYNALVAELELKTEYNAAEKKMGPLSRDIAATFLESQARSYFVGIASGFVDTIDEYIQASDIGITIDGAGRMQFDSEEFADALNDDHTAVLELLGATASGNSSNSIIQFNSASDTNTTPGTYEVEVTIAGGIITSSRISSDGGDTWRDAVQTGASQITGDSTFDDNTGRAVYPENGLNLDIDRSADGTFTATVRIKKGITGSLEDMLDQMLDVDGRLDTSKGIIDDKITAMSRRIELEEQRLDRVQTRLINKYARLERMLSEINSQMGAAGMLSMNAAF